MIEYSKSKTDLNKRIRDLAWMHGRLFAILAICVFPFSLYHLLVGVVVSEAMKIGLQLLTFDAVLIALYIIIYNKTRKAVLTNFNTFEEDGKIDFTLEKMEDGTLVFTRLTDEESFQITKYDIKSIKRMKYTIILVLENKTTIDLPKRADIEEILTFQ